MGLEFKGVWRGLEGFGVGGLEGYVSKWGLDTELGGDPFWFRFETPRKGWLVGDFCGSFRRNCISNWLSLRFSGSFAKTQATSHKLAALCRRWGEPSFGWVLRGSREAEAIVRVQERQF